MTRISPPLARTAPKGGSGVTRDTAAVRWILASEKPPVGVDVLVNTEDGMYVAMWANNCWCWVNPEDPISEVTHWLPLPPPPK